MEGKHENAERTKFKIHQHFLHVSNIDILCHRAMCELEPTPEGFVDPFLPLQLSYSMLGRSFASFHNDKNNDYNGELSVSASKSF